MSPQGAGSTATFRWNPGLQGVVFRAMASELASTVAQERARVLELEAVLAPRRQSEAATLAALERELHELSERRATADARTHDADEQRRQLSRELTRLQDGLSRARRAWVRLVVPVVGSVLLLLALLSVGVSGGRSWWLVALGGVLGFFAGRRGGRGG